MKIYIIPILIGGFAATFFFQAVMYASVGVQTTKIQKQLEDLNQKIDTFKSTTESQLSEMSQKNKGVVPVTSSTLASNTNPDDGLLSPSNLAQTLGTETSSITLKPSWNNVDVYDQAKASSKIVGRIQSGRNYPYTQKVKDWYQISLDSQSSAWIQAQFVYEVL